MRIRIGFFGLPLCASFLARDGHEIEWAVLAPIAAPGRRRLVRTIGASRVREAGPVMDEAERIASLLRSRPVDLVVSWFWTRRLPEAAVSEPFHGAIGVHPSLLPRHRGPNPFFWAIDSGDAESGVSVFRLTSDYDDGDVLLEESIAIGDMDSWQLARALDRPGLRLLRAAVCAIASGNLPEPRPQDATRATWAPEPTGDRLRVDWTWPAERVLRRIRALSPVPGLALEFEGVPFFVTRAATVESYPAVLAPGEGALWGEPKHLVIRTSDGAVCVRRAALVEKSGTTVSLSGSELAIRLSSGPARLAPPVPSTL